MSDQDDDDDSLDQAASAVANQKDADVLLLSGAIDEDTFRQVLKLCRSRRRKNVVLIILTNGGDPHAGYRISRTLQRTYEKFTILVPGPCKSAGTLVALGAHEIVMTDTGELGPLDVQLFSRENIGERLSGNDLNFGMTQVGVEAMGQFIECFARLAPSMETKVAAEAASKLIGRMYGRVFDAVHPRHVGSVVRSNQIGSQYAKRLMPSDASNSNEIDRAIHRLVYDYPAHGFVIDREEAATFLRTVRKPDRVEEELAEAVPSAVTAKTYVLRLAPDLPNPNERDQDTTHEDDAEPGVGAPESPHPGADDGATRPSRSSAPDGGGGASPSVPTDPAAIVPADRAPNGAPAPVS